MNRNEWASELIAQAGGKEGVRDGIVAQAFSEGSQAIDNPLDSTEQWPGSTDYNSAGVQNYRPGTGVAATLATMRNGYYPQMLRAIAQGDPNAYVVAVAGSPWGTWSSIAEAQADLSAVMHDPSIGTVLVAGTGPPNEESETMTSEQITTGGQTSVHLYDKNADGSMDHWWQLTETNPPGGATPWHYEKVPAA